MKINDILQNKINDSFSNGDYFRVIPLEKKESELKINDYVPVEIELLANSTEIKKIPGYYRLLDAIRAFEVNGFTFRCSSTTKQGKILTVYFKVQMGAPGISKRRTEPKPKPKPGPEPGPVEIESMPGWKKNRKEKDLSKTKIKTKKLEVNHGSDSSNSGKNSVPDGD